MNRSLRVYDELEHILSAIARIEKYTADVDEMGFLSSELIQDAVIRNLEVIGEAANKIQRDDPAFAGTQPEFPWQVMYGMRNRLVHGYARVDLELAWRTVWQDLPDLYRKVSAAADQGKTARGT